VGGVTASAVVWHGRLRDQRIESVFRRLDDR
jgi:hypothetical protein